MERKKKSYQHSWSYCSLCELRDLEQYVTVAWMFFKFTCTRTPLCYSLSLASHSSPLLPPADSCTLSLQLRAIKQINRMSSGPRSPFIFLFPITPRYSWPGKVPSYQQWVTSRHPQLCDLQFSGWNVKYVSGNVVIFTAALWHVEIK